MFSRDVTDSALISLHVMIVLVKSFICGVERGLLCICDGPGHQDYLLC